MDFERLWAVAERARGRPPLSPMRLAGDVKRIVTNGEWRFSKPPNSKIVAWALKRESR